MADSKKATDPIDSIASEAAAPEMPGAAPGLTAEI